MQLWWAANERNRKNYINYIVTVIDLGIKLRFRSEEQ